MAKFSFATIQPVVTSRRIASVLAVSLSFSLSAAASAQTATKVYRSVPTAEELAADLFGAPVVQQQEFKTRGGIRTRGLRPGGTDIDTQALTNSYEGPKAAAEVYASTDPDAAAGVPEGRTKLAFNIQFAFDSTRVLADSKAYMDRLGEVLSTPDYAGRGIVIVGHTDASGPNAYNQRLSVARANAVRDYLIGSWLIEPTRLQVDGKGEEELLASLDPTDATHRRVEFWSSE